MPRWRVIEPPPPHPAARWRDIVPRGTSSFLEPAPATDRARLDATFAPGFFVAAAGHVAHVATAQASATSAACPCPEGDHHRIVAAGRRWSRRPATLETSLDRLGRSLLPVEPDVSAGALRFATTLLDEGIPAEICMAMWHGLLSWRLSSRLRDARADAAWPPVELPTPQARVERSRMIASAPETMMDVAGRLLVAAAIVDDGPPILTLTRSGSATEPTLPQRPTRVLVARALRELFLMTRDSMQSGRIYKEACRAAARVHRPSPPSSARERARVDKHVTRTGRNVLYVLYRRFEADGASGLADVLGDEVSRVCGCERRTLDERHDQMVEQLRRQGRFG